MSLLIDALKQAEEARKQNTTTKPDDTPSAGLALVDDSGTRTHKEPDDSSSLRRPRQAQNSAQMEQRAARNFLEVKKAKSNRAIVVFAAVGLALLASGGGYVWWAIQPKNSIAPTRATTQQPIENPATSDSPHLALPPKNNEVKETLLNADNTAAPSKSVRQVRNAENVETRKASVTARSELTDGTTSAIKPVHAKPQEVTVSRAAYDAYKQGDIKLSVTKYKEVLKKEPKDIDALNALGAIALQQGNQDEAERYFRNSLAIDPKDASAQAQFALIQGSADPGLAESRLKNLIAEQPTAAIAHFTIGSLYAQQGRWKEAQQAFFLAHTYEPTNADTLFNLAVSLDHLHQAKLARQYYEQAIDNANVAPSFDIAQARQRAKVLADIISRAEEP